MKSLITIAIIFLGIQDDFDLKKIEFGGLGFFVDKSDIIKIFGDPDIKYPKYECGYHSDDQEGGPYYQLVYKYFNYIGSDKEGFQLEEIRFDSEGKIYLNYDGTRIDGTTTVDELAITLGSFVKEHFSKYPESTAIVVMPKMYDDGGRFKFKDGILTAFEYFSPC